MPLPLRCLHHPLCRSSILLLITMTTIMLLLPSSAARRLCASFILRAQPRALLPPRTTTTTSTPFSSFSSSTSLPRPRPRPLLMSADDDNHQPPPTPPTREQLMEEARAKVLKLQQKKELMVNARKAKMKRHKEKKKQEKRIMTEEERATKKAQEEQADRWIEEVYALDNDIKELLTPRLRIAIDLSYDSTASLYSSLARQLGCAYGLMRKAPHADFIPSLHLTNLQGEIREVLAKNGGDVWKVHRHTKPVFEVFPSSSSSPPSTSSSDAENIEKNERLIYLTPDSPNLLEARIDPTKVYVIGGLVDRVVLKGKSLGRARLHGVETRRLPLKEFFAACGPKGQKHMSNMALAVDRVIEILMKQYEQNGGDWNESLAKVFPGAVKAEEEEEE